MLMGLHQETLVQLGLSEIKAAEFIETINIETAKLTSPEAIWQLLTTSVLSPSIPFTIHLYLFTLLFPSWREHPASAPAYLPTKHAIQQTNLYQFMKASSFDDVQAFHRYTVNHYPDFWKAIAKQLQIRFTQPFKSICDLSHGIESPEWFSGGKMNIASSCFNAPKNSIAMLYEDHKKNLCKMTYETLDQLSNQIANSLVALGLKEDDAIGIAMPMNHFAVALYLGIIKMGGVVVSIADSFSSQEMATRLNAAHTKALFTQDRQSWAGKTLPLYQKIIDAKKLLNTSLLTIVLPLESDTSCTLDHHDITWHDFLKDNQVFTAVPKKPMDACNILFSSGTTAAPKAIVWHHTTPIKAASDAFFHHDIQPNDVLTWPTNLGWMMGPWLIFAALINQATLALYPDAPKDEAFGAFITKAKVTMLGVVPTLVALWRQTRCMETLDWRSIKCFSSTGECSNAEDMLYLMSLAHYKPVIEYCGGTEIGGGYLSSTLIQKNYPSLFTTPTMGTAIKIIDETGHHAIEGEVALIPPALGLSTRLLNADHHQVYFENMPKHHDVPLRRHGDQIRQLPHHLYSIQGRVDDAMNLGGIKVSAAEIERAIAGIEGVIETAAIAITPKQGGPSQLVIFAVAQSSDDKNTLMKAMQIKINRCLNPLFKITDLIIVEALPKTASNKVMRRKLREYLQD